MSEIKSTVDSTTLKVFELAQEFSGLTKKGAIEEALDGFSKTHLQKIKLYLEIEIFSIEKTCEGMSFKEVNKAVIEKFGENEFTEITQLNTRIHSSQKFVLDLISKATGESRQKLLEDSLQKGLQKDSSLLEAQTKKMLAYINKLEKK